MKLINELLKLAAGLLAGLKASGVDLGPVGDIVARDITDYAVNKTNYENGQAVPIGTFSENGIPGTIVAVRNGGVAAQSLGL